MVVPAPVIVPAIACCGRGLALWMLILLSGAGVLAALFLANIVPAEIALRLACAMWWYWETRGRYAEGQQWLERALACLTDPTSQLWGRGMCRLGAIRCRLRDLDGAEDALHRALPVLQAARDLAGVSWRQAFLG